MSITEKPGLPRLDEGRAHKLVNLVGGYGAAAGLHELASLIVDAESKHAVTIGICMIAAVLEAHRRRYAL